MSSVGHIELDRAVRSIQVGERARLDLGDLAPLIASIREHGLLQPITITPDGLLLCGQRRLAAVKELGRRTVNVWVRSGVSTQLQRLLAEQNENTMREPLSVSEAAALYREMKTLLTEDASRRQQATRFGAPASSDGAANLAAPWKGDTRAQAARLATGRGSYTTLERVSEIERIAADPTTPDHIRTTAIAALEEMNATGRVNGLYRRVLDARDGLQADADADAEQSKPSTSRPVQHPDTTTADRAAKKLGSRAFLLTWNDMTGWSDRYDAAEIGPALTADEFAGFESTVTKTVEFLEAARSARNATLVPSAP